MKSSKTRALLFAVMAAAAFFAGIGPAAAAQCGQKGCWSKLVTGVQIQDTGYIFLEIFDSIDLEITAGPTNVNCILRDYAVVGNHAAVISVSDPEQEEKYTMALLALTTGRTIGFNISKEPGTGLCVIGHMSMSN